jgi:hypothetical protein
MIQWYLSWAYIQRNVNSRYNRNTWIVVHHSAIHNSQAMETTQKPYNWWMDQENVIYIHNGVLLNYKE